MKLLQRTSLLRVIAVLCSLAFEPGNVILYAQSDQAQDEAGSAAAEEKKLAPQQLDSLVAPIALYPDPLLAQILAAATYPLDVVEAERWLKVNSNLKGEKLVKEAAKQDWEPSLQAMVVFPRVLQRMDQNLPWTTSLGNAFLAQQEDLLAAVQRMRLRAYTAGKVSSNSQQQVEVKSLDGWRVIVIEPANPQVISVPSYNPAVVYGPPPRYYPYPSMEYRQTGDMTAASAISFGAGVALGAAFNGCCGPADWGWGFSWGRTSAVVVNNNFFGRYDYATPYARGAYGTRTWAHNPYYRGVAPYSGAAVAGRYGGAAGVRTPYGAAGAVATPYGTAKGVRTPYGSAVKTPSGTYSSSPYGSADRVARSAQTGEWAGSRNFSSGGEAGRSAFGGTSWSGEWARASSDRGFTSMGGGGWRGGGGRRR